MMDINMEMVRCFFLWSSVFHLGILTLWFLMLVFAKDWMYQMHNRWFPMSKEHMIVCHYMLYGLYKLGALTFAWIPYLVLCCIL